MSFVYTPANTAIMNGLNFATSDIRVLMVMTNTTADTDTDAQFVSSIGTLDEMNGTNYARKSLTEAVNEDLANNRAEFDAPDVTWTALGAGTRAIAGLVVYKFITNDAASPLICYIDSGGFPKTASGGDIQVVWNAEGIIQLAGA